MNCNHVVNRITHLPMFTETPETCNLVANVCRIIGGEVDKNQHGTILPENLNKIAEQFERKAVQVSAEKGFSS